MYSSVSLPLWQGVSILYCSWATSFQSAFTPCDSTFNHFLLRMNDSLLNHYQHGTSPSNHLSDLNWKSPAAIQVCVLPPWGKGGGAFVATATPSPLLTSPQPFHTRSGSAWALEAFPGKPSYKRTAPASSPSPRQAPGDGYSESRCQDGLEPAGESRRARPAPATPRPGSPTSGIRSS